MTEVIEKKVRVRYAPSPTGYLHIGNTRTALFNWLFARHFGGDFIIRIEDTDTSRNIDDGEQSQFGNLNWLGLDWDESPKNPGKYGPYRQSERLDIYKYYIQKLLDCGLAYYSYKTPDELNAEREAQIIAKQAPHYVYEYDGMSDDEINIAQDNAKANGLSAVVRFHVPKEKVYTWEDLVKGHVEIGSEQIGGDWIIQKADGMPTYNFAAAIDDHLMEISHVLRGDEHVSNTPKQLMIYEAFNWDAPIYGHMTLILNAETGKKLSKRDNNVIAFISQYRSMGYLPEAMFNFISLLGWSPVGEKEIFTKKQLIKMFNPERLSKSPAKFDNKKLEWVNNQWIKNIDEGLLFDKLINELINGKLISPVELTTEKIQWVRRVISLYQDGISCTSQIVPLVKPVFFDLTTKSNLNSDLIEWMEKDYVSFLLKRWLEMLENIIVFDSSSIVDSIRNLQNETGVKGRDLWTPLRISVSRVYEGPNLGDVMELLGREASINNIKEFI